MSTWVSVSTQGSVVSGAVEATYSNVFSTGSFALHPRTLKGPSSKKEPMLTHFFEVWTVVLVVIVVLVAVVAVVVVCSCALVSEC